MINRRVVITGLGAISGLGLDVQTFWDSLKSARSAIQPFDPPLPDVIMPLAARVPDFDEKDYFTDDELSILDRFSQLAVIAAEEAVKDAGLVRGDPCLIDAATIIGSGCGGKHTDEATYDCLYKQQRSRAHPLTIPKGMPSAGGQHGVKTSRNQRSSICTSQCLRFWLTRYHSGCRHDSFRNN